MNYTLEDHFEYFCKELNLSDQEKLRIHLLIQEYVKINWRDAFGPSQLKSKLLLVDELSQYASDRSEIVSIGGWIGVTEYLMQLKKINRKRHVNLEIDEEAIKIAYKLNLHSKNYINLLCDAFAYDYNIEELIVINTSCEHLTNFSSWFNRIPQGARCIFQSNNMFGISGHINCVENLEQFILSAPLRRIDKSVELDIGNGWKRFMLVGEK